MGAPAAIKNRTEAEFSAAFQGEVSRSQTAQRRTPTQLLAIIDASGKRSAEAIDMNSRPIIEHFGQNKRPCAFHSG